MATLGAVTTYTDAGGATTQGSPPTAAGIANSAAPSYGSELIRAVDLTGFLISITANTTGNTVPTPTLKTRFETNIQGTVAASFSADFYRDDSGDLAWTTLPRGIAGAFVISRFGGKSTTTPGMPIAGDIVEVWPVKVTSRAASGMTSNTAEMFTLTCSVPSVPTEAATVVA